MQGICDFVACRMKEMHGMKVDPITDVVICCGQSEAFAATMFSSISFLHLNLFCFLVNINGLSEFCSVIQ